MSGKIVGCRYYNGYISIHEMVVLSREPNNQYDRNAIRVDNVRGNQIGHIPRGVAAKLDIGVHPVIIVTLAHELQRERPRPRFGAGTLAASTQARSHMI